VGHGDLTSAGEERCGISVFIIPVDDVSEGAIVHVCCGKEVFIHDVRMAKGRTGDGWCGWWVVSPGDMGSGGVDVCCEQIIGDG